MTTSWQSWARKTFPDAHIIDILDESRYEALIANRASLGLELRTLPAHRVVVLDEVQRVPALLNEVHRPTRSQESATEKPPQHRLLTDKNTSPRHAGLRAFNQRRVLGLSL